MELGLHSTLSSAEKNILGNGRVTGDRSKTTDEEICRNKEEMSNVDEWDSFVI